MYFKLRNQNKKNSNHCHLLSIFDNHSLKKNFYRCFLSKDLYILWLKFLRWRLFALEFSLMSAGGTILGLHSSQHYFSFTWEWEIKPRLTPTANSPWDPASEVSRGRPQVRRLQVALRVLRWRIINNSGFTKEWTNAICRVTWQTDQ